MTARGISATRARRILLSAAAFTLLACGDRASISRTEASTAAATDSAAVALTGAGATFPYPLYQRWFSRYAEARGVQINYHSVGSGEGVERLIAGNVQFGASDMPMQDADIARLQGGRVVHVPMMLGAVAITYQLGDLPRPLRLSSALIADLFLGRIKQWDDARIAAENPDITLPNEAVRVVYRADSSGTTFIFSDFLTAASSDWAAGPGRGNALRWPVGTSGRGNEGVAGAVKSTMGAIGYVETGYARQNRLPVARVQNREGFFVAPAAFEVASAAVNTLDRLDEPADLRVSIVNAPGKQSYPIASFSWLLLAPRALSERESSRLLDFIEWALLSGEAEARTMGYEPLPTLLTERVIANTRARLADGSNTP